MGQGQTLALVVRCGEWAVLCLLSLCPAASLAFSLSSPPPWLLSPLSPAAGLGMGTP